MGISETSKKERKVDKNNEIDGSDGLGTIYKNNNDASFT